MLGSIKYGKLRSIQLPTKKLFTSNRYLLPYSVRYQLKEGNGFYYKSSGLRNYSTKDKAAAGTADDEKLKNDKDATAKRMINTSLTSHKALLDRGKGKTSKKEIWKFVKPYLMTDGKYKLFYLAMLSMVLSKGLALGAPYCLKVAVNAITQAEAMKYNLA